MSLMRLLTSGKTLIGLQDSRPQYRMADPRSMPTFGSGKSPFRKKAEAARAEAKDLAEKISAAGMSQPELQSLNTLEEVRPDRESDGIRRSDGPLSPSLSPSPATVVVSGAEGGEGENFAESRKQKAESRTADYRTTGLQDNGEKAEKSVPDWPKQKAEIGKAESKSAEVAVSAIARQGPARVDRKFSWFSGARDWAGRLGSLLPMRPRPARSVRAVAPQQGEMALSLDAVRVVRNDLSDCDLEFVAKKQRAVKGTTGQQDNGTTELLEQSIKCAQTNAAAQEIAEISGRQHATEESGAFGTAWGRATRVFGAAFARNSSVELVEKS